MAVIGFRALLKWSFQSSSFSPRATHRVTVHGLLLVQVASTETPREERSRLREERACWENGGRGLHPFSTQTLNEPRGKRAVLTKGKCTDTKTRPLEHPQTRDETYHNTQHTTQAIFRKSALVCVTWRKQLHIGGSSGCWPPGLTQHDPREAQTHNLGGPWPQFHKKTSRETEKSENEAGEGKKREILGASLFGAPTLPSLGLPLFLGWGWSSPFGARLDESVMDETVFG